MHSYQNRFLWKGTCLSGDIERDKNLDIVVVNEIVPTLTCHYFPDYHTLINLIFMAIPVNFLLWGCESWAVCKRHLSMLQSHVNKKIRRILKLTMWDVKEQRITNEQLLQRFCNMPSIQTLIDIRTCQFLGKLVRGQTSAPSRQVLIAYVDSKRPRGRPLKCNRECMRDSLARLLQDVVGIFIDEMGLVEGLVSGCIR